MANFTARAKSCSVAAYGVCWKMEAVFEPFLKLGLIRCPMKHVKTYGMVIHLEKHNLYLLMIIFQLKKAIKSATHFRTHPNWVFVCYISIYIHIYPIQSALFFIHFVWFSHQKLFWFFELAMSHGCLEKWRRSFLEGSKKKGSEMAGWCWVDLVYQSPIHFWKKRCIWDCSTLLKPQILEKIRAAAG